MECCLSPNEREQKQIHDEIERQLNHERKLIAKNGAQLVKLLLLGTAESGKSTFLKQMHIINGNGFPDEMKSSYIKHVHQNILSSLHSLIKAMDTLNIKYELRENIGKAEILKYINFANGIDPLYLKAIKSIWYDRGVQQCYMRNREYYLIDSSKYFFNNIDRIADPQYLPSDQDILRVRVATTSITEYDFNIKNKCIKVIDVGGQRSERYKWINFFEDAISIIFLVAISEYDQTMVGTKNENRLNESKSLFKHILSFDILRNSSIILFLNKTDIFEEKIHLSHIIDYFPEFAGDKGHIKAGKRFILQMFKNVAEHNSRDIYTHFTCVTDTNNIRRVFDSVKETILNNYLNAEHCLL